MYYAPVLLPTLCRYDSLVQCIDSLKRNTWAEFTDLIIALDYPSKDSHWDGYRRIRQYLQEADFSCFHHFTVITRQKNYGAIDNFRDLIDLCFSEYERCICVFDDLVFSPNFIQYMDEMLEQFQESKDVCGVLGYSYPLNWAVRDGCNGFLQNFSGSIWGIAFWKSKFYEMASSIEKGELVKNFSQYYKNGAFRRLTDWAVIDYVGSVCYGVSSNSFVRRITDIALRIYVSVNDKRFVMPTVSKVRNHGFDGSGAFCEKIEQHDQGIVCSQNYAFDRQKIDENASFTPIVDLDAAMELNREKLNAFDIVAPEALDAAMKRAAYYVSGGPLVRRFADLKKLFSRITRRVIRSFRSR